ACYGPAFLGGDDLLADVRDLFQKTVEPGGKSVAASDLLLPRLGGVLCRFNSLTSVLMSAKSLYISLTASSCCSRAARSYGARRSRATSILVVTTISPLVSRTVYVPGRTRGPCEALNATCAARGTLGGLSSIDQVTRAIPRRLLGESVSTSLPCASRISSRIGPNTWRACW